jgi:hypothetical protein
VGLAFLGLAATLASGCGEETPPPTGPAPEARAPDPSPEPAPPEPVTVPGPVVPGLRARLEPIVAAELAEPWAAATTELATGDRYRPWFATPAMADAFADPWAAMTDAEARGLAWAEAGRAGRDGLRAVLDGMLASLGKPAGRPTPMPPLAGPGLAAHADRIEAALAAAAAHRDRALADLPEEQRAALFAAAGALARGFSHQVTDAPRRLRRLNDDRSVCGSADRTYDWEAFSSALATLLQLVEPGFLASLEEALRAAPAGEGGLPYERETPWGRIVFAGAGADSHRLVAPVAFLADLGGDDAYSGTVASSFDPVHAHAVVVDFAGNDRWAGGRLGLATGRTGIGVLLDRAGDDRYELEEGSGGVGLAGVGVLVDEGGDDVYRGARLTQGAALGGLGLLHDLAGDDVHTSHGLSLGFGGPGGVGLLLDGAGNDRYQAGGKFPSAFNRTEASGARPGDAAYRWRAMAMGAGIGRRIVTSKPEEAAFALGGGLGALVDLAGDDVYRADNFSQGCGYYYGQGVKLDLSGRDDHGASRYGQGAGVHYGMGVFFDYAGDDRYGSNGPIQNAGGGFDHGVGLFVDAGPEGDAYDLAESEALGRAGFGAVAVAADLGGDDVYATKGHPGRATEGGAAVFLDAGGDDDYAAAGGAEDGATRADGSGGLLVDRADAPAGPR